MRDRTDESQGLHTKTSRPCKGLGLKARTNAVVGKTNAGSPRDVYQEKCRLVRWRPFRIAHSTSRALLLVENHQDAGKTIPTFLVECGARPRCCAASTGDHLAFPTYCPHSGRQRECFPPLARETGVQPKCFPQVLGVQTIRGQKVANVMDLAFRGG